MKHPAALVREAPRWAVYSAVGALFLAAGMLTASLAGSAPGSGPGAVPRASGSAPRDPADATTQEERELRPGEVIATVRGDDVGLYGAPGSAEPVRLLPQWSHYGKPTTLLGISTATVDGQIWYQVKVPAEPNGSTGWVRASQVDTSSTDLSIHVFLAEHQLELRRGDEVLLTTTAAVGAEETPTPLGLYFVTDPLPFANPDGVYGAYALGLSGYSEVLEEFEGGPPQIAIHGTNLTDSLGRSVSNGCVRLSDDAVLRLAEHVVLGTPVIIEARRPGQAPAAQAEPGATKPLS